MKFISLTQGMFAQVDDADFEWLSKWKWCFNQGYAQRTDYSSGQKTTIEMHRVIMDTPADKDTDHWDGDGLNNCRHNLRSCTGHENQGNSNIRADNTSGFKGVSKSGRGWRSRITKRGKRIHLGSYDTREDAARAYDKSAVEYFGEFARTNY